MYFYTCPSIAKNISTFEGIDRFLLPEERRVEGSVPLPVLEGRAICLNASKGRPQPGVSWLFHGDISLDHEGTKIVADITSVRPDNGSHDDIVRPTGLAYFSVFPKEDVPARIYKPSDDEQEVFGFCYEAWDHGAFMLSALVDIEEERIPLDLPGISDNADIGYSFANAVVRAVFHVRQNAPIPVIEP